MQVSKASRRQILSAASSKALRHQVARLAPTMKWYHAMSTLG